MVPGGDNSPKFPGDRLLTGPVSESVFTTRLGTWGMEQVIVSAGSVESCVLFIARAWVLGF